MASYLVRQFSQVLFGNADGVGVQLLCRDGLPAISRNKACHEQQAAEAQQ